MNVSQLHIQNVNWLVKHKNSIKQQQDVKETEMKKFHLLIFPQVPLPSR